MGSESGVTFPAITAPAHAALLSDAETGRVMCPDGGQWWEVGMPSPYIVFPDLESARVWADAMIKREAPYVCGVYDSERREVIRVFNPNVFKRERQRMPWWKTWFRRRRPGP